MALSGPDGVVGRLADTALGRRLGTWARPMRSRMGANVLVYGADFSLRIAVQLGYFLVISRALGAAGYGVFVSLTALTFLASAFSGLGAEQVLIRRVARDGASHGEALGNALAATILSWPLVVPLALGLVALLNAGGLSAAVVLPVVIADVMLLRFVALANACFQAREEGRPQLFINVAASIIRLGAAGLAWWLTPDLDLAVWVMWYLAASAASAGLAIAVVLVRLGRPRAVFHPSDMRDGSIYALEFASMAAVRDLDKPVVAETLGAEAAGVYAAAFRIVDTACVPVRALLRATYTRYFHHGRDGASATLGFARRVFAPMVVVSLGVALALVVMAPVVPKLIGEDYARSVPVIRWLALYPLLLGISAMGADVLRSLGRQRARVIVMLVSVALYIPLVWWGAEAFGPEGAAAARTVSQFLLFVVTAIVIARVSREDTSGGARGGHEKGA